MSYLVDMKFTKILFKKNKITNHSPYSNYKTKDLNLIIYGIEHIKNIIL